MFFVRSLFWLATFVLLGSTLAGLVLPRVIHVERSVEIAAAPDRIFPFINSQRMFISWSPWSRGDSRATYDLTGADTETGSILRWQSKRPEVLSGSQQLVEVQPNVAVRHSLQFDEIGEGQSLYELHAKGDTTVVSGKFAADLGPNPFMRLLGIMVEERIAADLRRGLSLLRDTVEQAARTSAKHADRAPAVEGVATVSALPARTSVQ